MQEKYKYLIQKINSSHILHKELNGIHINYIDEYTGYIISIEKDKIFSDKEMAEYFGVDEFDYMNLLSLNGSIKYEEADFNENKVYSIFESINLAENSLFQLENI